MPNTIKVNRIELLKFYDCRPADSVGHATAINAIAGEDLACGILRHYFANFRNMQIEISPHVCTQGTTKGKRLDRWITVYNDTEAAIHYQTEIKNWSAHSLGGKEIGIDVALEHLARHKMRCWSVEWDHSHRTLKKSTAKVLIPMKKVLGDPLEPLLCMWAPMHPDGAEHPWFVVDLPEGEHFGHLNVFSMSSYLRTLNDTTIELEMPDLTARSAWLRRLFSGLFVESDSQLLEVTILDSDEIRSTTELPVSRSLIMSDPIISFTAADNERMAAVPAGRTLEDNFDLRLYYAPMKRSFKPHRYLALYKDMAIVAIGEIEKTVLADLIDGRLVVTRAEVAISPKEAARITTAIKQAPAYGWEISKNRRFWLVSRFVSTYFRKVSNHGMMNKRYFDLRKELSLRTSVALPDIDAIADRLRNHTWE